MEKIKEPRSHLHIMAVDCCEHVVSALTRVPFAKLTAVASRDSTRQSPTVDVIVIGVSRYPVRRLFLSQLRRVYPQVPVLILRRIEDNGSNGNIIGEFVLSEHSGDTSDLEIVRSLRNVLPIPPCSHVHKANNYDTVREVVRVIAENFSDPSLDLDYVARKIAMPSAQLSRILNQQVGVSFRQLLRQTRIEEAKRMLASREYRVKEVAARVGFTDSHYFSRSFKELTGFSASEYDAQDPIFG